MIEILMVVGAIYLVAFSLVAFLPGWRTLLAAGVIGGLPIAWVIWELDRSATGLEVLSVLWWFGPTALGFVSGLVVRGVTLLLRRKYSSLRVMLAATLVGFFMPPGAIAGVMWWDDWNRRLPSEACLGATFQLQIADAIYSIPGAPLFSIVTAADDRDGAYYLNIPSHWRALCEQASRSAAVPATALHIRFREMQRPHDRLVIAACARSAGNWLAELCREDTSPSEFDSLVKIDVYSPREYNHRHMMATQTYQDFLRIRNAAKAGGVPLGATLIGNFEKFSNGWWVARSGKWATQLAEPLTLYCPDYPSNKTLDCRATHEVRAGAQVTYEFHAARDEVEATLNSVEKIVDRILSEMLVR